MSGGHGRRPGDDRRGGAIGARPAAATGGAGVVAEVEAGRGADHRLRDPELERDVERNGAGRRLMGRGRHRGRPSARRPGRAGGRERCRSSRATTSSKQARVMADARAAAPTVPIPEVVFSEPDPAPLGTPFFVMGRVDGRVPPDVMPYNFDSWVSAATPAERTELQDASLDGAGGAPRRRRRHREVRVPRGRPARRDRHASAARRPGGLLRVGARGHRRAAHRADLRLARRAVPRRRRRPPACAGATPASATCCTTASGPPRSSTGRWRCWPRPRSTWRGSPTCTRSSRTSPACSAWPGCPTSSGSTTARPPTSDGRAARLGTSTGTRCTPRCATPSSRSARPSGGCTSRASTPRRPRRPHHAQGRARAPAGRLTARRGVPPGG